MDHHVAKQAAGALDVGDRRRGRVARQDGDELDIAGSTFGQPLLQGGEIRIEAAVEADHQRDAGLLDPGQRLADALGIEVDRLLAEHRLAGRCRLVDEIGVGVGRRADQNGVDGFVGEDLLGRSDRRSRRRRKRVGAIRERIGDCRKPRTRGSGDVPAVDLADPPGAQQRD